jgi:hypothetical protein
MYVGGKERKLHSVFWCENLKERAQLYIYLYPSTNDSVIAVKCNSYFRFHKCLISAFYKSKHFVAYISPKFQHTFHEW